VKGDCHALGLFDSHCFALPISPGQIGPGPVDPRQQGYRDQPPHIGKDYEPYYSVPRGIPPGRAGSAEQDAIRQEAMRQPVPISPGQIGPGPVDPREQGYRHLPVQGGEDDEPPVAGTGPYDGIPGVIPPGRAGSAEQDAIRQEAMRPPVPISPGQIGPGLVDPRVTGSTGGGGDPRNMAAFPPDVRPETGPKKELPPQFRRTLVEYPTKEPAGTIIIDTPNTYLYLVLGNGKALRYGVGVGREGFNLVRRATGHEDGAVARLESAGGDDRTTAISAALHGWGRDQPARRARPLSWQDGVPHPRHQSALDHRYVRVLWAASG
jgi:lipoprotein-anchoring transpeptidase ErfK/SrfK